jgi:hypothetical protein
VGLDERVTRLERDEVLADLKRERFYDDSTPIEEIEEMLVARGVDEPLAREVAELMVELREERLKGWD